MVFTIRKWWHGINVLSVALAKSYTKKTIEGTGAIKGDAGFSPIVSSTKVADGTKVSITDETHTEEFVVENGLGVPTGGTLGQVLTKTSDDNYVTEWKTPEKIIAIQGIL